jgi:hypothetical protein
LLALSIPEEKILENPSSPSKNFMDHLSSYSFHAFDRDQEEERLCDSIESHLHRRLHISEIVSSRGGLLHEKGKSAVIAQTFHNF